MTVKQKQSDLGTEEARTWRRVAIVAGLVAVFSYPVLIFVNLPRGPQVTLGASFGPALAIASFGLAHILRQNSRSAWIDLAAMANILAGALVTAMIIVQLSIVYSPIPSPDKELTDFVVNRLWDVVLGLDVSFDVFIGLGTALFGFAMLRDRRFGKLISWLGILIGVVVLLGFNFYTFPVPPADAGLFDPGPVSGLWYLAVVILVILMPRRSNKV